MTANEALQQAQRCWGEDGYVYHHANDTEYYRFRVGKRLADVFMVLGVGHSWEEAFQAAELSARKPP